MVVAVVMLAVVAAGAVGADMQQNLAQHTEGRQPDQSVAKGGTGGDRIQGHTSAR